MRVATLLALLSTGALAADSCCPGHAFHFDVTVPAPDVYRVEISPADPARTNTPAGVRSDTTAFRLNGTDGKIEIVRFDSFTNPVAWSATIRAIDHFGRAAVPGIEVSWTALPGEALYGTGERFDALNQAGKKREFWIQDAPSQGGAATYYCTPVFYSSSGYGLFFTNNPEATADLNSDGSGVHRFQRAGASATFFIAVRPTLKDLIKARASLFGPYRGIPDWAWGPWISRNSFENQAEAEEAINGMLSRDLPVAAIVQEAWKGASDTGEWNAFAKSRWPDLPKYFALCEQHGIRTVLWQVPIVHPSSPGFDEAVKKKFFVRRPDGSVSFRKEWLEGFANIDFTNPEAREYWKAQMRETVRLGIAGFKADDGEDIKPDDVFFDGRRGWQLHNEYSTLYNRTLMELLDEEKADGMLWSRSGSLGNETCPALWAGDQEATWQQLHSLLPAGLSASISGMPFWGHDIGAYLGRPSPELYIRWLQFGAFSPLMQYHGIQRREPWEFGPEAEKAYKLLATLRMKLKPTLIALGREAAETGMPIMRPMTLEFPDDPRFASEESQYMLGPDLLVAPILEDGARARRVKFPAGRWQHLLFSNVYEGPSEQAVNVGLRDAPVFVREGATLEGWKTFGADRAIATNPIALPSVSVVADGSRVAGTGTRTVRTRVQYLGEFPFPYRLAQIGTTNIIEDAVAPNETSEHAWRVSLGARDKVGEEKISFLFQDFETATVSFVRSPRWAVVGPFPAEPKQAYGINYPPEWEQGPDVAFEAGFRVVQWQSVSEQHVAERDGIDFTGLFGPREHAAAYALAYLDSDHDQDVELRFGSDDTLTVWLNDEKIHSVEAYRLAEYDQEIVKARLAKGRNKLLVKVCQDRNPWRLMFRLTGPGGASIEGVTDGFADLARYDPARPQSERIVTLPKPLTWHVKDKDLSSPVVIDLAASLGGCSNCFVDASAEVIVDKETPVEFACGSDDGLILKLNGATILSNTAPRGFASGSDRVRATLRPGSNLLDARITQGGGDWKFKVEVWDVSVSPARLLGSPAD